MRRLASVLSLTLFTFLATSLLAQEFAADFVDTKSNAPITNGRIFVSKDKIRFESSRQSAASGKPVMIMDLAQHTMTMLMPERHMYVSYPQGRGMSVPVWRPVDPANACPDWEAFATQLKTSSKLKSCVKTGNETVNGRSAVKYVITSTDGAVHTVWVDPKLRAAIKTEGGKFGVELRNIVEAPQPASLFEIPAGFKKLDMGGMGPSGPAPQ